MGITVDNGLYTMARVTHPNMSRWIESLMKADLFKTNEGQLFDAITKRQVRESLYPDDFTPEMWAVLKQLATTQTLAPILTTNYQTDFQRAKQAAQMSEPTVIPDSQERW